MPGLDPQRGITSNYLGRTIPKEDSMASAISVAIPATPGVEIPTIPLRELLPWLLMFALLGALAIFFVSADQGALSIPSGNAIHEWVHDGRHLLGYPCH
jgi:hypothetical protein